MLSIPQIERLVDTGAYKRLVVRILANGRCRAGEAAQVLVQPAAVAPAALGLALQRTCELSYGPTPLCAELTRRLIALQHPDGRFRSRAGTSIPGMPAPGVSTPGDSDSGTSSPGASDPEDLYDPGPPHDDAGPAAASVALRALLDHRCLRRDLGLRADDGPDDWADRAIERGLAALARAQAARADGLLSDDPTEGAVVLWQLGRHPEARAALCVDTLRDALSAASHPVLADDLRRLAHAMAA